MRTARHVNIRMCKHKFSKTVAVAIYLHTSLSCTSIDHTQCTIQVSEWLPFTLSHSHLNSCVYCMCLYSHKPFPLYNVFIRSIHKSRLYNLR